MHVIYMNMEIYDGTGDKIILTSDLFMSTFKIKNIISFKNSFHSYYIYHEKYLISGCGITEVYQTFKI